MTKVFISKFAFKSVFIGSICLIIWFIINLGSPEKALPKAEFIDLEKFMGRWYVHGFTPILVDKKAYNAIEHYRLDDEGKIQTTYQFRDSGFDGELKTYRPVGWVYDEETSAEWRMQFIWPFRSKYVVLHIDASYTETIIGHPNRKWVWIMLRYNKVNNEDYERLLSIVREAGYDCSIVQRLPHDWSEEDLRLRSLNVEGL